VTGLSTLCELLLEGTVRLLPGRLPIALTRVKALRLAVARRRRTIALRLAVASRRRTVPLRLALERDGLTAGGAQRGAIAEELADHQDRKYERVKEDEVMAAPEEEEQVEPVDRKGCPEKGIPDPAAPALAALDAGDDEHRYTAPDQDQGIQIKQLRYLAVATGLRGR
jgi:hypothetical protein